MQGHAPGGVVKRLVIAFLLAFLSALSLIAQPPPAEAIKWQFVFGGKVTEFNEKKGKDLALEACTVTLFKGSVQVQTITTDKNGRFKFKMDPNGDYTITVTKSGYITKKFAINTYNVNNERAANPFAEFDVEIDLFKMYPGLDYSCLDKPIARIIYNPAPDVDDFDYDRVYTAQIQACIDNLKRLADEARKKQRMYDDAIARADKAFGASDWAGAKAAYQEALGIIATEQYPKDQIAKCDEKLAAAGAQAATDAKYQAAIKEADAKFAAKDWAGAKTKYQDASNLKPVEQYPKDQISKCDANMAADAASAANEQKYKDLIKDADAKFAAKDWAGAKAVYQQASALKAAEAYPKAQIALCDKNIAADAAAAANEQKYKDLIKDADTKFAAKDWAGAKAVYQQASALKAAEQYPKDQIALCDKNISADAATAATEQKYQAAIKDADAKFAAKDWAGAKAKYTEASGIKPAEQYPKDQIALCDKNAAADKATADAAAKDKQYNDLVKEADTKFAAKDWAGAKVKYQEALGVKPAEKYPKDQIALCDKNIAADAASAASGQKYKDLISQADAKFAAKDWAGAKGIYQQASALKAAEQYPKDQIAACDKNIADDKATADKAAQEKKYTDAIAAADAKFDAKDWAGAKVKYTEASALKPSEQYPKDRIKACDDEIAKQGVDKQYTDLVKQADTKFTAKDWAGAKALYEQASGVKPSEQYPKDRIKLCDDAIAKAGVDKQYTDLVKQADAKFTAKDWTGAKGLYEQASGVKPDEQYPKDRIKACDDAIAKAGVDQQYNDLIKQADTKFAAKDFVGAKELYNDALGVKPNEQYPKDKLKACDDAIAKQGIDKQYADLVAAADAKFKAEDWQGAKDVYQQASTLKPGEAYPKTQIKACDDKMAGIAKDAQYNDLIKQADDKFKSSDWAGAKSLYQQASALKTAEAYPKSQIALCDTNISKEGADKKYNDLIAQADAKFNASDWAGAKAIYLQASAVKAGEAYPKEQVAKCDEKIKEAKDKPYNDLIAQADTKFQAKDWSGAKALYQQAAALKATETYPKDQIKICDTNISKEGADKKYNDLITQADEKFNAKDWTGAKAIYLQASAVKAEETYPKDQAAKCDANLKADKDKAYSDLVAQADGKFDTKDWAGAKALYQQASTSRPAEQYPKDRIKACDDNIKKEGADKKYSDLIAQADAKFDAADWTGAKAIYLQATAVKADEQYPKDRAKACDDNLAKAGTDKKYNDLLAAADAKFNAKDWTGAKAKYLEASTVKPAEQYPKDKIKSCDDNLLAEKDQKYKDAIAAADAKFDAKDFTAAKVGYQSASAMKPEEQYPKDRIKLCDDEIAKSGVDKKYNDLVKQADMKFAAKDWAGAKAIYLQATAVKADEQYPKDQVKLCDDNIATAGVDKQYNDLIKQADAKFTAKAWSAAKDIYQQALAVKPNEQYPKDRMKACDENLASAADKAYNDKLAAADAKFKANDFAGAKVIYQEASTMRPTEQYPKDQIAACDDGIAKSGVDKQYTAAITAADTKFNAKDYAGAKAKYEEASGIKPAEQYPKDRIKACDEAINASLSLEQKYKSAVARGDSAFARNDYETAQSAYTEAKNLKPSEPYPPKKLAEINTLLASNEKDRMYRQILATGDSLLAAKDYDGAKRTFTIATTQRPTDQYPKDKLAEIKRIQDDIKFEEAKNAKYNKLITQADAKFKAKDYKGAKSLYQQSLQEKPLELYPKKQIEACDKALNPAVVINTPGKDTTKADVYINNIAAKYPQGVTEQTGTDAGAQVTTRYVVVGDKGWVYTKKVYSWGTFYFKDSQQISESTFNYETSIARVQQQQAEYDKNKK